MIIRGHVLDILVTIPDNHFHCVMTSPPYWSLRRYDIPDVIWGGEPGCKHRWGQVQKKKQSGGGWATENYLEKKKDFALGEVETGSFCLKCSAWRGQLGLEPTLELYLSHLMAVFQEVRRVLRPDGVCWVNIGDSYGGDKSWGRNDTDKMYPGNPDGLRSTGKLPGKSGLKPKDLCLIPFRFALAMQADGWWVRQDIIWAKKNPMPESVTDRCTKAHEYIFLCTKSAKYFYDAEAVKEKVSEVSLKRAEYGWDCNRASTKNASMGGEGIHVEKMGTRFVDPSGRNLRSVWEINTQPYPEAHFATFPEELPRRCILAGTSARGCCPECGKPWERVVEKTFVQEGPVRNRGRVKSGDKDAKSMTMGDGGKVGHNGTKTLSWRPTCDHKKDPVPCRVLDPFIGSGTTGKVAESLGRDWVGIDLGYGELSDKRTVTTIGLPI